MKSLIRTIRATRTDLAAPARVYPDLSIAVSWVFLPCLRTKSGLYRYGYGRHAHDQWSLETILDLAQNRDQLQQT